VRGLRAFLISSTFWGGSSSGCSFCFAALSFGFFLPLYILWNVLSTQQSVAFISFAVLYTVCLFAAAILAVVNFVAMTRVRDECHHLFDSAISSGRIFKDSLYSTGPVIAWSNIKALAVILFVAGGATGVFFSAVLGCLLPVIKHLGWIS